jgi:hypothetical protein
LSLSIDSLVEKERHGFFGPGQTGGNQQRGAALAGANVRIRSFLEARDEL